MIHVGWCVVCAEKMPKTHTNDKTQTEASHWIRLRSQMIRGQFHKRTYVLRISRRHCGVEVVVGQWNGNRASIELTVIAADGCVYVCASRRCSKWMNISLSLSFSFRLCAASNVVHAHDNIIHCDRSCAVCYVLCVCVCSRICLFQRLTHDLNRQRPEQGCSNMSHNIHFRTAHIHRRPSVEWYKRRQQFLNQHHSIVLSRSTTTKSNNQKSTWNSWLFSPPFWLSAPLHSCQLPTRTPKSHRWRTTTLASVNTDTRKCLDYMDYIFWLLCAIYHCEDIDINATQMDFSVFFLFCFCLCTNVNVLKDCEKFVVYMRN